MALPHSSFYTDSDLYKKLHPEEQGCKFKPIPWLDWSIKNTYFPSAEHLAHLFQLFEGLRLVN